MKTRLPILALFLLLAGCGPIIALVSKTSDGVSPVAVKGDPATLRGGGDLLVYAPFAKTDQSFYICRGEEAANFAEQLQRQGLFKTMVYFERALEAEAKTAGHLRKLTAAELKNELGLEREPGRILFGTLVKRAESATPFRGVIMQTTYRLEFYDISKKTSTTFELEAHFLAEEMVANVVAELGRRIGH